MGLHDLDNQSPSLGKYRLLAELGRGGMAQVYLAVASGPAGFHKLLVVKQIDADLAEDPDFVRMFLDEARLAAQLNHPNVVQTYEVGQEGNRYFIAMEYLEGQPLSSVIGRLARRHKVLTPGMQLRVMIEALTGLHYAHELCGFDGKPLNVVHRDVSPHNIFVTYSGQIKVVDFGIAKACTSSVRTATGVMKGKVGYMGPEQTRGDAVDARADVFSVGVILWEIATGQRLFAGVPDYVVMQRIINDDIPVPSSVCSSVSPRLEEIILRAMAPNPDQRHASAAELAGELEDFLRERGDESTTREVGRLAAEYFAERRARIQAIIEAELAADAPVSIAQLPRLPLAAASQTGEQEAPTESGVTWSDDVATPHAPVETDDGAGDDEAKTLSAGSAQEDRPTVPEAGEPALAAETRPAPPPAPPAPEPPAEEKRLWSRRGEDVPVGKVALFVTAGVLCLFIGGTAYLLSGDDAAESAAAATTIAPQQAVTLRIESKPAGASVIRAGERLGVTPLDIVVADPAVPGRYEVELAGYDRYVVEPQPLSGDLTVMASLVPEPAGAPSADAGSGDEPGAAASAGASTPRPPAPSTGRAPIAPRQPTARPTSDLGIRLER